MPAFREEKPISYIALSLTEDRAYCLNNRFTNDSSTKPQIAAMKIFNAAEPSLIPALISSLSTLQTHLHSLCRSARTRSDATGITAPGLCGTEMEEAVSNLPTTNWGRLVAGNS